MPENDESRAKLAAQRAIEALRDPIQPVGIAESPEARQQRFASRAPDGETPEQRTARYLEKARRAGMLQPTPTSPLGVRNQVAPETVIELDAEPAQTRYAQTQQAAAKASSGQGIVGRAQEWLDSIHKGSPEEDERIRKFISHTFSPLTITDRGLQTRSAAEANDEQDRQVAENQQKIDIIRKAQENAKAGK